MFLGCNQLTTPPELPALSAAYYCYRSMFSGCTALTSAPYLSATTLDQYCYSNMFYQCTSLVLTQPILPAIDLTNKDGCYENMFGRCYSLTTAPQLPATGIADECYARMFTYCSGLTEAPYLPATNLLRYCYQQMFENCKGLSNISVAFTAWNNSQSATDRWVNNVASIGTFTKPSTLPLSTGYSYIPSGWTVIDK